MLILILDKWKKFHTRMFEGEVTFLKTDFWLMMLIAALLGVLWGLLHAPLTHGVSVAVGNNNGNTYLPEEKPHTQKKQKLQEQKTQGEP